MALKTSDGAFNPGVQETKDPNYLGYSHVIEPGTLKSTMGEAIKDFGNIFEASAKGAVQLVSEAAKQDTINKLQPIKDEEEAKLALANQLVRTAAVKTGTMTDAGENVNWPSPKSTDILGNFPGDQYPEDIKNIGGVLKLFQDAKKNGAITETDYWGRTSQVLSDIRSRYPSGFRDVIDEEARKVLGGDPANKHIQSLIQSINSFQTGKDQQTNHILNELSKSGYPGSEEAYAKLRSGEWDVDKAVAFMAPFNQRKYKLEMDDLTLKNLEAQGKANKEFYKINANDHASGAVQDVLHSVTYLPGITNPTTMNQIIIDGFSGRKKYTPEQYEAMGNLALAYKAQAASMIDRKFAEIIKTGGMTNEEAKQIKESSLSVFDEMHKDFSDGKVGLAYEGIRRVQALARQANANMIDDPRIGPNVLKWKALRDTVGDPIAEKAALADVLIGMREGFRTHLEDVRSDLISNSDVRTTDGFKAYTESLNKKKTLPDAADQIPKSMDRVLSIINGTNGEASFVNPLTDDDTKERIFNNFFSPKNMGALKNIEAGYWSESKNKWISGSQEVFNRLSSPDVVAEVNRLSNLRGGHIMRQYEDYMKTTLQNDLLAKDLAYLKDTTLIGPGESKIGWKVSYNDSTHQFGVMINGRDILKEGIGKIQGPQRAMAERFVRINMGMRSLANVAEGTGQDVEAYALPVLLGMTGTGQVNDRWYSFTKGATEGFDVTKIEGIPGDIVRAVVKSREDAEKLKAQRKQYQK